ncbi:MAG: 30S ribosomal protein S20 [Candidatus Paceibacterota bacterium]|jgi:small subunit ribosomal protein S20
MPITRSAKRALRGSLRKKSVNDRRKKTMKEVSKKVEKLVKDKKVTDAKKMLSQAYKAIDKAVKRGVIKKNTAARKKSRLSKITK